MLSILQSILISHDWLAEHTSEDKSGGSAKFQIVMDRLPQEGNKFLSLEHEDEVV